MLNTSGGTFFIFKRISQFCLSFEKSWFENQNVWIETQGGHKILQNWPPTVLGVYYRAPSIPGHKNTGKRIFRARPFQQKKARPKILSERGARAIWSWKSDLQNKNVRWLSAGWVQSFGFECGSVSTPDFSANSVINFKLWFLEAQKELRAQISQRVLLRNSFLFLGFFILQDSWA